MEINFECFFTIFLLEVSVTFIGKFVNYKRLTNADLKERLFLHSTPTWVILQ